MGVTGTICTLCGLPAEHDHYVPTPGSRMLKIFRGASADGGHTWDPGEDPFRFGPEHAWLRSCVAVTEDGSEPPVCGVVEDAELTVDGTGEKRFVGIQTGDPWPFHAWCWQLLGKPKSAAGIPRVAGTHAWSQLTPYHQQLFALRELRDDGKGWMLEDPSTSPRSAARIEALRATRQRPRRGPATIADLLARDDDWISQVGPTREAQSIRRLRTSLTRVIDVRGYPDLVWLIKPYTTVPDQPAIGPLLDALDTFELALKAAVEADDAAILACVMQGKSKVQYVIYARDAKATHARLAALEGLETPLPAEFDDERDDRWAVYFGRILGR